jgi:hyaluronan synthase
MHKAAAWAVVAMTAALIAGFHFDQWSGDWNAAMVFYVAIAGWLLWTLAASAWHPRYVDRPVSSGRVVVIVPVFNEKPGALYDCVRSLILQTRPPEQIIVMDDGSDVPVIPIDLPTVEWYRQENRGKRWAQMEGLRLAGAAERANFVVTVDSDSVVAPDGLEQVLRAMSDPQVQAATGACVVRNRDESLLTRVVDLEVMLYNAVMRRVRSVVGAVAPTSGPLAIYRANILWDNAEDYLSEGTYSDDRRLTHYSLLRGQVVAVDEAVVETEMPATVRAMFRQRTRWFKGYWRYMGWEIRNLSGWAWFLRVWNLTTLTLYPLIVGFVFVAVPVVGGLVFWQAIPYWLGLLYALTSHYMERPNLPLRTRLLSWLALTPLLVIVQAMLIRPAMYYAIVKVRDMGWSTRGADPKHRRQRGRYRLEGAQA